MTLARRLFAEYIGTALLLATVVSSGIMGTTLSNGNDGIALLANAGATAAVLYVAIALLGPVSGAHLNPLVTLMARFERELGNREAMAYIATQFAAAVSGVVLAHAMFHLPPWQTSQHARTGHAQWLSEGVATYGLLLTIVLGRHLQPKRLPVLVASYIFAAYWFTASTSFANPAVTFARSFTATFSGIRPQDVIGFTLAQLAGGLLGYVSATALLARPFGRKAAHARPARAADIL